MATPPFLNYVFGVAENGLEGLDMLQLSTVPEQQVDAIPTTAATTTTTTNSDAKVVCPFPGFCTLTSQRKTAF